MIYNNENIGDLKIKDTLYVVDVSSIHLFTVKNLFTDSIGFFNFLGGEEYQENGKSLSYFNKRAKAKYLKTIPLGDYLLSRELGEFFYKNNFFVCLKFSRALKHAKRIPQYEIRNADRRYDFAFHEIKNGNEKISIMSSYCIKLVADKSFDFAVVEEVIDKSRYFSFFVGDRRIAQMFEGIGD